MSGCGLPCPAPQPHHLHLLSYPLRPNDPSHRIPSAHTVAEDGDIALRPGIIALSSLLCLEISGIVGDLADTWRHPGLTHLALLSMTTEMPPPLPSLAAVDMPALRAAQLDTTGPLHAVPPGLLPRLSNITRLRLLGSDVDEHPPVVLDELWHVREHS